MHNGVDSTDITDNGEAKNAWRQNIPGFADWWVLQFRKGYKPFTSQVHIRCKIS